jgi:hypothetical protein
MNGYDPRTGQVIMFKHGVPLVPVSANVEVSYEREEKKGKGQKILSRAPLIGGPLWANPIRALEGFDHLLAIDTNTKVSNGEIISVAGVVHGTTTKVIVPGKTGIQFGIQCCMEFRGIKEKAENIAWAFIIQAIQHLPSYRPFLQYGLIVDCDLNNLEKYNNRESPIYNKFYLPDNMKFIYASSEVKDSAANTMLALADKESRYLRDYIIRERCNPGLIQVLNEPFTHFKEWTYEMLPQR